MAKPKSSLSIIYSKFPFNQCDDHHLNDKLSLIKQGVNLTIQIGTLNLPKIEFIQKKCEKFSSYTQQLDEEEEEEDDEEEVHNHDDLIDEYTDLDEDFHLPPSPILIPFELPKSSMKRRHSSTSSTYSFNGSPTSPSNMSLLICHNKLQHFIDEFFQPISVQDNRNYKQISNYVINSIIQNETNMEVFLNKIVNFKYKHELIDLIQTLFTEKYEEVKLEELIDFLNNLFNLKVTSIKNLSNPMIYNMYYKIWKLNLSNYKFYEEEYFFDYFTNSFTNLESVLLQNGFLINYKRFVHYFSKDMTNYEDEDDEDEDTEEEDIESNTSEVEDSYDYTESKYEYGSQEETPDLMLDAFEKTVPKSYLPVDHVLYNQFIKEIE
ncbi:hypothetical protein SBY92_000392 [Candida maltosa Xu316]